MSNKFIFLLYLISQIICNHKVFSSSRISSIFNNENNENDNDNEHQNQNEINLKRNIDNNSNNHNNHNNNNIAATSTTEKTTETTFRKRIQCAKYKLWQHGAFALDENILFSPSTKSKNKDDNNEESLLFIANEMEEYASLSLLKHGPIIRKSRRNNNFNNYCNIRGGSFDANGDVVVSDEEDIEEKLKILNGKFGSEFELAIKKNIEEHDADCELSCKHYYCDDINNNNDDDDDDTTLWNPNNDETYFASYSMGAVPPEDFSNNFGFPLDLIKVTQDKPLFNNTEASTIISIAEKEGVANNEYKSGKYKLGGDWLTNLPNTKSWFNKKLRTTFFPLLYNLFPEVITSTKTLRAHSVSLLKYNSSHPRTDVHIDNGILAMTISMTPLSDYKGGGTYFEHMSSDNDDNVIHMDVGHGTFRPGSVRHGGHTVKEGTRYILGAFLLLVDKVEHVRRLKNKGSEYRKKGDLEKAEKYFMWALAINPKCTTCIKDWAEIHLTKKEYKQAEIKLLRALELLEFKDSDALFTLGVALSELGKEDESMDAYMKSLSLNAQDAELCYNLGIQFGKRKDYNKEFDMYSKAVAVDSKFGGAWVNWGVGLAERGQLDEAEQKFKMALSCAPEIVPKAMFNLALVHQTRTNQYLSNNKLQEAKISVQDASKLLEAVKPLLFDNTKNNDDNEMSQYTRMYRPLRLQVHKLSGQILAALRDFNSCEEEFRDAVSNFPNEGAAWDMLSRILQLQGKSDEAKQAKDKANLLQSVGSMFGS